MTIRRATHDDTPALVAMALRFIAESRYQRLLEPNAEALARLIAMLIEHGAIFVVDVADHGIVGMLAIAITPHPMSGTLVATEYAWWVEPEWRGGTGAVRMLATAEAWARDRGARFFQMIAPSDSSVGELYVRRGYAPVETTYVRPLAA